MWFEFDIQSKDFTVIAIIISKKVRKREKRKGDYGADDTSQSKVPTDQRRGMGVVCPLIRNKSRLTNVHNPRSLLAGIIASKYPSASTDFESSPA